MSEVPAGAQPPATEQADTAAIKAPAKPAERARQATDLTQFHGPSGKPVPLKADGSIDCRACGLNIVFLPETFPAEDLPDGAPRTVNHTGCPSATAGESPAGPNAFGLHETINVIDQAEVASFYADKAAFSKARGGK